MLFNSIEFIIFLPVVFLLYWFVFEKDLRKQNFLLLVASYFFYGWWDWRFLFLLLFSTMLDYVSGLKIAGAKSQQTRSIWFWLSVVTNLGFLVVFKYFNFFIESFAELVAKFGLHVNPWTLAIVLPVGISFYTFHGLSYVIDIYKGRIQEEKSFIDYAVFVSFFPLLVAGPIERATHLLPQIKTKRQFDYRTAVDGLKQILWGLFKKVIVADTCAEYVDPIFANPEGYSGAALIIGAVLFAFQIYGDFSGYSDIALGTARLFGITLLRNFAYPYFSRDIAEFWRRWHISLSSWFRDYVYIPLGGSKVSVWKRIRNTFIIFVLSGIWHGANWTFVVWGILNALYFLPLMLTDRNRVHVNIVGGNGALPSFREFLQMGSTFALTTFAWIFFRSPSISSAIAYVKGIVVEPFSGASVFPTMPVVAILCVILLEWTNRFNHHALQAFGSRWFRPARLTFYVCLAFLILLCSGSRIDFIYFQF